MHDILSNIWLFVRGESGTQEFEAWLYSVADLENALGPELYLDVISVDYRDRDAVFLLKQRLATWAENVEPLACRCITLPKLAALGMGSGDDTSMFATLQYRAPRGEPFWWLSWYQCTVCAQAWLVAAESRHNDLFLLRRLSDGELSSLASGMDWPHDFDKYEILLRMGKDAGHSVRYMDPIGSSELFWTMHDLAEERPGIRLSEIVPLLNLDQGTARAIAERVLDQGGKITIDV